MFFLFSVSLIVFLMCLIKKQYMKVLSEKIVVAVTVV